MELSIRLKTVAEAVTKGNRVADVGTDHGYVPIYLVKNNLSPAGIAMDVNKGPLEKAQEHIREEKLGGENSYPSWKWTCTIRARRNRYRNHRRHGRRFNL